MDYFFSIVVVGIWFSLYQFSWWLFLREKKNIKIISASHFGIPFRINMVKLCPKNRREKYRIFLTPYFYCYYRYTHIICIHLHSVGKNKSLQCSIFLYIFNLSRPTFKFNIFFSLFLPSPLSIGNFIFLCLFDPAKKIYMFVLCRYISAITFLPQSLVQWKK